MTTPRTSPLRALAGGVAGIGHFILGGLTAPFRHTWDLWPHRAELRVDVSYATFRDKLFGVGISALGILALVIFGAVYANLNTLPFWRILLFYIVSMLLGLIFAAYLRYFMRRPFGPTASLVAAGFLGTLFAIMTLVLLFEL